MRAIGFIVIATSVAACNWMTFDDLADSTWVDSTNKPDVKSSDWGIAIGAPPVATSASGGQITVIGAGEPTYSILNYSDKGSSSLASNSFRLGMDVGIITLDTQPIVMHDPTSDKVAVVGSTGTGQVAAVIADSSYTQIFGPTNADAGTYLKIATGEVPLVAAADTVYAGAPTQATQLKEVDNVTAPAIKAMAPVANGAVDDVIVWAGDGKLLRYPNSIYVPAPPPGAQPAPVAASAEVATGFSPGKGSHIFPIPAPAMSTTTYFLLEGHVEQGDGSFLAVVDGTTLAVVGSPITVAGQRSGAVLPTPDGKLFAVAGYPTATVDGTITGQVIAYEITVDSQAHSITGINPTAAMTLHDAQPDESEQFGRSIAVMQFNGHGGVLVVAADNEIFAYFHTVLYGETRAGKS